MATEKRIDREFHSARSKSFEQEPSRGPKPVELSDYFYQDLDPKLTVGEIVLPPGRKKNLNQPALTLGAFITGLTPENIAAFGKWLSAAKPELVDRVMTVLPDIALQPTTKPNYALLAVTIVKKSPPIEKYATQVSFATSTSSAVRSELSIGPLTRFWNAITGASSWSDFSPVKTAIDLAPKPAPFYKRWWRAIFSETSTKATVIGSQFSSGLNSPSSSPSPSVVGSMYSGAGGTLPASTFISASQKASPATPASSPDEPVTPVRSPLRVESPPSWRLRTPDSPADQPHGSRAEGSVARRNLNSQFAQIEKRSSSSFRAPSSPPGSTFSQLDVNSLLLHSSVVTMIPGQDPRRRNPRNQPPGSTFSPRSPMAISQRR